MAKNMLPYLALDSAGERTILCDYPVKMFDNTTKKETTKMNKTLSADQLSRYVGMRIRNPAAADRYWQACTGRRIAVDASIDAETAAQIKEFLSDKLSDKDHTALCAMLNGENVEAEDTEPAPDDIELPKNATVRLGGAAADAASFNARFPGLSHVRLDNSGIQPRKRPAAADAAASFAARFPDLARIKLA